VYSSSLVAGQTELKVCHLKANQTDRVNAASLIKIALFMISKSLRFDNVLQNLIETHENVSELKTP
jgi:hypothetical protein